MRKDVLMLPVCSNPGVVLLHGDRPCQQLYDLDKRTPVRDPAFEDMGAAYRWMAGGSASDGCLILWLERPLVSMMQGHE